MLAAVARPGLRANSDETNSRPRTSFPAAHRRPATASHARPSTAMLAAEERRMLDQQPTLQHRLGSAGLVRSPRSPGDAEARARPASAWSGSTPPAPAPPAAATPPWPSPQPQPSPTIHHVNTTYLLLKRQLERDAPGAGGDDAITEVDDVGVS